MMECGWILLGFGKGNGQPTQKPWIWQRSSSPGGLKFTVRQKLDKWNWVVDHGSSRTQIVARLRERNMDKTNKKSDKSTWAIGGTTIIGIGVGFIFLKESPLFFVASILIGIGLGLVITSLISREKK
jgi:hypothetical protein